ncbi:MAG: peptidylprolyl isomerase [bacterium]|nr:MAG: peptidylprolyl isomerase [bacterium]
MPLSERRTELFPAPIRACLLLVVLACVALFPIDSHGTPSPFHNDSTVADTLTADTTDVHEESDPGTSEQSLLITMHDGGRIVITLLPDQAPLAVERILKLVAEGFYDGLPFHRVESYLVQIGKKENVLPPIEGEMFGQNLRHEKGMVGMARLPSEYDSATTQFYICKKDLPKLNGEYTLFGRVVEGMEIIEKIKKGDKAESITILE